MLRMTPYFRPYISSITSLVRRNAARKVHRDDVVEFLERIVFDWNDGAIVAGIVNEDIDLFKLWWHRLSPGRRCNPYQRWRRSAGK